MIVMTTQSSTAVNAVRRTILLEMKIRVGRMLPRAPGWTGRL